MGWGGGDRQWGVGVEERVEGVWRGCGGGGGGGAYPSAARSTYTPS